MPAASVPRRLRPVLRSAMERFSIPGAAVGIVHDGDEYTVAHGVTAVDFPLDVDEDTMFQIGSTTKTYTATLLMMYVEEGRVDLEASVRDYLPKFKVPDEQATKEVTVRHLVTHTAGWIGDYFDDVGRGDDALRRIVSRMATKAVQVTPIGTIWAYNNAGFYVLGRLLETIGGRPYEELVTDRIFKPLGMDHSFFFPEDVITYKTAIGHQYRPDGPLAPARPWGLTRSANPAGGIVSNVRDQLRYARFHLGDGRAEDGTRVLEAATVERMRKAHAPAGSLCDNVGISWLLEKIGNVTVAKHGGSVNGHMSEFFLVPERRFGITVLTNGSRGHELGTVVVQWALAELIGVERAAPKVRKLTARAAARYVGEYEMRIGRYVVTHDGDRLVLTMEPSAKALEDDPSLKNLIPPPLPVAMVSAERGVVQGDYSAGSRVEFLGNGEGVEWLRYGGRVSRRLTSDPA